jgi:hypothetical protein
MVKIFSCGERWNFPFHEAQAAEWFHLSPNENIFTIARMKTFITCVLNNVSFSHIDFDSVYSSSGNFTSRQKSHC